MARESKIGMLMLLVAFMIASCGTRNIVNSRENLVDSRSEHFITKRVLEGRLSFKIYSAKVSTKTEFEGKNYKLKTSVKVIHDSLIWASVTYSGVPIVRIQIRKDSFELIHKREKYYLSGTIQKLNDMLNTSFDYQTLEDLIVGNPVFFDKKTNYKMLKDSSFYVLSTHGKRQLKKIEEGKIPRNELKQLILQYKIKPQSFLVHETSLTNLMDATSMHIDYGEYKNIETYTVPSTMKVILKSLQQGFVFDLKYSKIKLNGKVSTPFKVPDSYEIRHQ